MEASALPQKRGLRLTRSRKLLAVLGDERLVDQLRSGNEAAFEAIWERHHRAILSFCRHMLGNREEAEDAVQQTFINAHKGLLTADREIKLRPWLYAIARNRCLSMLRARRERTSEVPEIATAGLAHEVEERAELRELLADVRKLPEQQRAALILSELGDLPHSEIANVIGVDPMKVRSLVFQARSALIEDRNAREIPCEEIRETLATVRGGALRRGPLRRHIAQCEGCREFRDEVRRQRAAMAVVLPVIPSIGLKESALAAVGIGGGSAAGGGLTGVGAAGAAASGGGGAAGVAAMAGGGASGGVGALITGGAAKVALAALIVGGTVGGGVAVTRDGSTPAPNAPEPAAAEESPAATAPGGGPAASGPGGPLGSSRDSEDNEPGTGMRSGRERDGDGGRDGDRTKRGSAAAPDGGPRGNNRKNGEGRPHRGNRGSPRGLGRGRGKRRGPRRGSQPNQSVPDTTTREPKPPRPPRLPEVGEGDSTGDVDGDAGGKVDGVKGDSGEPLLQDPRRLPGN